MERVINIVGQLMAIIIGIVLISASFWTLNAITNYFLNNSVTMMIINSAISIVVASHITIEVMEEYKVMDFEKVSYFILGSSYTWCIAMTITAHI